MGLLSPGFLSFAGRRNQKNRVDILLLEPFFTGAHRRWCEELKVHSKHKIDIFSMPGKHWKWRMHGAAVEFAAILNQSDKKYDLILVSDFLDLATFRSLYFDSEVPAAIYFHENQINYPWSKNDNDVSLGRDNHYGWINFTGALVADRCFFNSTYHLNSFINALPEFLGQFPDGRFDQAIDSIKEKSEVLYLGLEMNRPKLERENNKVPVILWNHRWEYDKNPDQFFMALKSVEDLEWDLLVLGESFGECPPVFKKLKDRFRDRILQWGYVESTEKYSELLYRVDIVISTAIQDFFGGSVVEAIYSGAYPILPNRLAYPEHVNHENLYNSFDELTQKLRLSITGFDDLKSCANAVERYNWTSCIKKYDAAFEMLVNHLV